MSSVSDVRRARYYELVHAGEDTSLNFSLVNEMIKEFRKGPRENLRIRFQQVIQYIKSHKDTWEEYEEVLRSIIYDPIYNFLATSMTMEGRINLSINLNLARYFINKSQLTKINTKLNLIKNRMASGPGYMLPKIQKELSEVMKSLMSQLWEYVEVKSGINNI